MWGRWKCLKMVEVFYRYLLCSILFGPECNLQNGLIQSRYHCYNRAIAESVKYRDKNMGIHVFLISLIPNVAIDFFSFMICHSNDVVLVSGINRHLYLSQQTRWAQCAVWCRAMWAICIFSRSSFSTCDLLIRLIRCVCVLWLMLSIILLIRNRLIHIAMLFFARCIICMYENMNLFCL